MKQSLIRRLSAFLTVNFVHFRHKGKERINAKVVEDIKFTIAFDEIYLVVLKGTAIKVTEDDEKFKKLEDMIVEAKEQVQFK